MSASRPNGDPTRPAGQTNEPETEADPAARVSDLEGEVTDLKDRLLRALAEQENVRRRVERERQEAVRFAASDLARDLLSTLDNLRRAIESVPAEKAAEETVQRLLTGVAATERGLLDVLEKHGIRRIDALGQSFDPERHEAVYQVTDAEHPAGTVAEVLQPGYLYHDRLLRPAMVGVAATSDGPAEVSGGPQEIAEGPVIPSCRSADRGSNDSGN